MVRDHRAEADRWVALAESEYEMGNPVKAHAASQISVAHAALHDLRHPVTVDYLGQLAPTGAQARQQAAGEESHGAS